jgi:MEMO1 family protein
VIRKAAFAGSFYDSDPELLLRDFEDWFSKAKEPELKSELAGLVSPHAGYMYSGFCAAHSYKLLTGKSIKTAIILHPSHRGNHFDFSISPFTEYHTPLGNLKLDEDMAEALFSKGAEVIDSWYHQNEHSMEVQLPFLKYILPDVRIVPVMFGVQNISVSRTLAQILADVVTDETVVIVSTDLSHYHSALEAGKMDAALIRDFMSNNIESMYNNIKHGRTEACGFGGILTLMFLAENIGNCKFTELLYTHSGVASGDNSQVVGYLAAALSKG